jgi:hypothetical protein
VNRFGTCLSLVLLLCGLDSAASAQVVDASVCDVLADPASFDGKVIRFKAASVVAGFDEFVIEGTGCKPAASIWLSYPGGTKGKAGPAAVVRLQLAKNSTAVADSPRKAAVMLQRDGDFQRFDSLLATPYRSSAVCLGCPRYTVTATLIGRLDGVSTAGVVRDKGGKVISLAGFGNLNLYRARLVLQSVSEVVPREVDYSTSAIATKGDSRRVGSRASADQLKRAAEAYGEQGEDNGVAVSFGVANEVSPDDGAKGHGDSPDGILFDTKFDMDRLGKQLLPNAMSHIGTHIADVRSGVSMQGIGEAESRAWQATFRQ